MIFVTGDTHGDFSRFRSNIFTEQRMLTKDDYVIICGDFGIWDNSKTENHWLDWLADRTFTTLFVTGNHSNYDLLSKLPVTEWNGGKVQFIRESVIHLMRAQIYNISGKSFFTMGGASSHDIDDGILEPDQPDFQKRIKQFDKQRAMYRINHISWWKEELPNDYEYEEALKNLDNHKWKVDYIISHCSPSSIMDLLGYGHYSYDRLTDFFETIKERCEFEYWFFGHYHDNRIFMNKYILLYKQIVRIDSSKISSIYPSEYEQNDYL